jgi:hypothetical protein
MLIITRARFQDEQARAVRAEGLLVFDAQPYAGMAQRPVAAIAGDDAAFHHYGFHRADLRGWCLGGERQFGSG